MFNWDALFKTRLHWLLLLLLAHGCALQQAIEPAIDDQRYHECQAFIEELNTAVTEAGVSDAGSARITGFPYLRSNRFLASFRDELEDSEPFDAWVDRLQALALQDWQIEWQNLPADARQRLQSMATNYGQASVPSRLEECSQILRNNDLATPEQRERLRRSVSVPDAYHDWQRVLGLYPLSSLVFRLGIANWHSEAKTTFALPRGQLPVHGDLLRYKPSADASTSAIDELGALIQASMSEYLAIPSPSGSALQLLFDAHAPVLEIDTVQDDDLIGRVYLDQKQRPDIDTSTPVIYRYLSHMRHEGQVLLQLNYMMWFPARTKTSAVDLLAGHLDGIIWRVSLMPDGRPFLYDSIHLCGCYHMLFPTRFADIEAKQAGYEEPLLFGPAVPYREEERIVIRIASGTHYIQRVGYHNDAATPAVEYSFMDANRLRSLAGETGTQSIYGPDGIIASSARGERYFFWPMGVPSAGAMRQPGKHATAFVGRRHFDDARLFEPYLMPVATSP